MDSLEDFGVVFGGGDGGVFGFVVVVGRDDEGEGGSRLVCSGCAADSVEVGF